jgi:GntR family transcriptional regulator/MocR family aminotransferase
MTRRPTPSPFRAFTLDSAGTEPLHRQLYDELRAAILGGRIASGSRLPASRELAAVAGVSRNTVLSAYEQLLAEGYIHGRPGSGTYVADALPESMLPEPAVPIATDGSGTEARRLSKRGERVHDAFMLRHRIPAVAKAFRPGLPALDHFPMDLFRRLADRRLRRANLRLLGYCDPQGYLPLREAVTAHLLASRGVRCNPANVVIVNGSQQGITLCARLLTDPGDEVWFEEPGYFGARASFRAVGATIVPVPVDREGLVVSAGEAAAPRARLAYCTPSHQNPLGVTLSLPRRMALLQWAQAAGAWIIEDDNASEYRFRGRPLASLQGIDTNGRVIYVGTFSKVLFSSLRLGYVVVPDDLVATFVHAHDLNERGSSAFGQAVVADFMLEGHFARHLRRMRTMYAERLAVIERALAEFAGDVLEFHRIEGGLNQPVDLPPGVDDLALAGRLLAEGIVTLPLSDYCDRKPARGGLVLGFAGVEEPEIRAGIQHIAAVVREIALAGNGHR